MSHPTDDVLDRLLRADAAASIPDAGFSQRVLKGLPKARRRRLEILLVPTAALVGCILAMLLFPGDVNVLQGTVDLVERHRLTPAAMGQLAIGIVLLVSAIVLAADAD